MQPHHLLRTLRVSKQLALLIAFLVSAFALSAIGFISSTAQSPQKEEREIEDTIPKHLPIKVKVKTADKVKDLDNEKWARDLEIEIENTSGKPIYYLRFSVVLPDVKTENNRGIAFPLSYGRDDFIDYNTPVQPDDMPLKPGERYTFRIPIQQQQGWERFVARRGVPKKQPKKVQFIFQLLSFGDGTGFDTTGGLPFDINKKQAGACVNVDQKSKEVAYSASKPPTRPPAPSLRTFALFLPANFCR